MLEISRAVSLWNQWVFQTATPCQSADWTKIDDSRYALGCNIILDGKNDFVQSSLKFVPNRIILVLRPELSYGNEVSSLGKLSKFSRELIWLENGVNLNESAESAARSALDKNIVIKRSILTDIFGNQSLLLEVGECLGLEFRTFGKTVPDKNDSKLYLIYFMLSDFKLCSTVVHGYRLAAETTGHEDV